MYENKIQLRLKLERKMKELLTHFRIHPKMQRANNKVVYFHRYVIVYWSRAEYRLKRAK